MVTLVYDVLKDDSLTDGTKRSIIEKFDEVLSLDLTVVEEKEVAADLENEILAKIEERKEAKKNKNFELADKIRDDLSKEGIILIDTREGTTYKIVAKAPKTPHIAIFLVLFMVISPLIK